ncbi:MAG: nucleotidyltransferase domain-containing protein [Oscillospiraceae bacterium]|jgi:predicted nucleotidyltransferase|nr:nucleotidyltransferase domain-containing protein [Oscillospiraceae bacterium]
MLGKEKVREIAKKYSDKVRETINPTKIVLFGSYVNGTPDENSDIDIAVIINDFQGEWLATSSALYNLTWSFDGIIEPHLLDETHDPSGFVEHVIKTGEVVYQSA